MPHFEPNPIFDALVHKHPYPLTLGRVTYSDPDNDASRNALAKLDGYYADLSRLASALADLPSSDPEVGPRGLAEFLRDEALNATWLPEPKRNSWRRRG